MIVHQVFAQIFEGVVKNIIVCDNYETANWLSRATYGDSAIAVDCLQYPCSLGDIYRDNRFYKIAEDGTEKEIMYVPTPEQKVDRIEHEVELTEEYKMDLDYRLSRTELGI